MIVHIATLADWRDAQPDGPYRTRSLDEEGFIHCSTIEQVELPARLFFAGRSDLVLLHIDEQRLAVPVRWEPGAAEADRAQLFPHVYGPIAFDAVLLVEPFEVAAS